MNWSDIGDMLVRQLPTLGGALGAAGGTAGSQVGSMIGGWVAEALGVEATPSQVSQALTNDPEAMTKLRQLELEHKLELRKLHVELESARLAAQTAEQSQVNETLRAELASDKGLWRTGWRPAIGWVMALSFLMMGGALSVSVIREPSQLPSLMDGIIALIVAMGAVLGVNINARSRERHTALTGTTPLSFMDAVKTRVAKK